MVARTERAILEAFNKLIQKYEFEKITVDMIIKEANVSRSTFYRYFIDKFDVMNANFKLLLDDTVKSNQCKNYTDMFYVLLESIQSEWRTINRVFDSSGVNSFSNFIANYSYETALEITKQNRNGASLTKKEEVQLDFFCHGVARLYELVVNGKCDLTSLQVANALLEIAPPSLKHYWWIQ